MYLKTNREDSKFIRNFVKIYIYNITIFFKTLL